MQPAEPIRANQNAATITKYGHRFDQLAVDLPEPKAPNPAAAAAVQELIGRKFGEMSMLMNYTFSPVRHRECHGHISKAARPLSVFYLRNWKSMT